MGLYIPPILGGNSYLSWFYDRGAIKDPAHTGTSKGLSQAINRGPIRKFLPKYANVYVTIQSHALSAGAWARYVTANGVRDGLGSADPLISPNTDRKQGQSVNQAQTQQAAPPPLPSLRVYINTRIMYLVAHHFVMGSFSPTFSMVVGRS